MAELTQNPEIERGGNWGGYQTVGNSSYAELWEERESSLAEPG